MSEMTPIRIWKYMAVSMPMRLQILKNLFENELAFREPLGET
jgi:hypothetical protein